MADQNTGDNTAMDTGGMEVSKAVDKLDPLEDCLKAFKCTAVVTLIIGTGDASLSVQVPQLMLEGLSKYFSKALRRGRFVEGETGVITFPDDDVYLWKIMLFWILRTKLPFNVRSYDPPAKTARVFANCWILGDKYDVAEFQDAVMLQLLDYFEHNNLTSGEKGEAFKAWLPTFAATPADSSLMRLLAQEVACAVNHGELDWVDLQALDGTLGFWPHFSRDRECFAADGSFNHRRMHGIEHEERDDECEHWTNFMVGNLQVGLSGCDIVQEFGY